MKMRAVAVCALALVVGAGCAAKKQLSAEQRFAAASDSFRDGAYVVAVEQYRELLDQYPFSEYSEEAELKIAHAHYLNDSCPEAIASLADFQRRQPTSPHLPFVGFLLGQCYERQMRPPDRDQGASQSAHAYYLALTQQYPTSPFADLAREHMSLCRETLAKHEMVVADFYASRGNAKAAEYRLLDLVNRFNDTDIAANALYELGALYREEGNREQARLAFAAVAWHHPANGVARKARRALHKLVGEDEPPASDPLPVLQAQAGRHRSLALARAVELPQEPEPRRGPGPSPGFGSAPMGGPGPFGGSY